MRLSVLHEEALEGGVGICLDVCFGGLEDEDWGRRGLYI